MCSSQRTLLRWPLKTPLHNLRPTFFSDRPQSWVILADHLQRIITTAPHFAQGIDSSQIQVESKMVKSAPPPPIPNPSALTTFVSSELSTSSATTSQVLHNLHHQHLWTSLKVHDLELSFPISLISGIPPHRVYTHPDEQLYMVEHGLREEDVELDRMFVLPTVQGQSWSLERMSAVFDAVPTPGDEEADSEVQTTDDSVVDGTDSDKAAKLAQYYDYRVKARRTAEWGGKRLLLAMIDKGTGGEGTVVYYVAQEGTVKPRQN
ncbi:hypothetical protein BJX64DRAFT_158244 [Aspergillus heterothallicus]